MSLLSARERAIVAALADTVAAPEAPLPPVDQTDAVAAFERWLAYAPPLNRAAFRAALHLAGARLRSRDRDARVAALRKLPAPIAQALTAAVSASYFGDREVMRLVGYDAQAVVDRALPGRDLETPDPNVEDGAHINGERRVRCDVVVIGSGAGGAPVAKELAEGGLRVVILEEGEQHSTLEFTARPRDTFPTLYRDGGQTTTIGNPPIVLPLGQAVGGTTLVNSGTCFRTPAHVLERWEREAGLHLELDPFLDRVEREINVVEVPAELAGRNAALARRGADALGWSGGYLRRNVRGCVGSGVCAFGCPANAKQHMGVTYLPKAWAAGATTFTGVRARRIELRGDHAVAVEATTSGGGRVRVEADHVVVAAGTIHTPGLLGASGLGARSGQLGRNLSIHPATAVWALFDEDVDLARGVPQSYYVDEFASEGIMLEGVGGPPDYVAMAMPYAGDRQRELMLGYRHLAQMGLMVSDTSRGRVHFRMGRPIVRYDLNARDTATFHAGLVSLTELWWAAGAHTVLLPLAKVGPLYNGDTEPLRRARLRARDLKLMAFHPLGTARADADPDRGVVDGHGRVHGTANVWVADGSAVPSALGVNPQLTIMALATRLAFHLLGAAPPEPEPDPDPEAHVLSH